MSGGKRGRESGQADEDGDVGVKKEDERKKIGSW